MEKPIISSAWRLGMKYGVFAILATTIFLPLPIIIGDYFGRINTVGHYSGPFPASWICVLSIVIVIPLILPFAFGGCVIGAIIASYRRTIFLNEGGGILGGMIIGILTTFVGLAMFETLELLEALGGLVFVGMMTIWGMILFGWIGHRIHQSIT
jgi:hypothetical protein